MRVAVSHRGYVDIYSRWSRQQKTVSICIPWGERVFSQLSRIKVKLIRRTHKQNIASTQLPQATRSQAGKPEEFEFGPQSHLVSLSGNLSIVQARDTLRRRSYQPIVFASLWSCGAFDHLQLIRVTLIFLNAKSFIKQINCAHINIFQKKECWFKIRMEFLRPILAKIELICQQPAMTKAHWGHRGALASCRVLDRMAAWSKEV